jgi:hypothetical protein
VTIKTIAVFGAFIALTLFWSMFGFPLIMVFQMALGGPSPAPIHSPSIPIGAVLLAGLGYVGSLVLLRRWSR